MSAQPYTNEEIEEMRRSIAYPIHLSEDERVVATVDALTARNVALATALGEAMDLLDVDLRFYVVSDIGLNENMRIVRARMLAKIDAVKSTANTLLDAAGGMGGG